ncbi:hypothetical protein BKA56DRAFT_620341 [Ilyonectria sp. MPI-CAGE-AT-0026]|nr:hypothetical protein BKA56DRAFT_620341 [Ilyonectria sp. MPI-CAGE-AT-0026]
MCIRRLAERRRALLPRSIPTCFNVRIWIIKLWRSHMTRRPAANVASDGSIHSPSFFPQLTPSVPRRGVSPVIHRLSTDFPFIKHPSLALANDDTNSTRLEENTRYARPEEKATVIERPADFVTSRRSDPGKFQRLKQGRLDFPRQRRRQTESIPSSKLSQAWIPPPDFIGPLDCYEAAQ